MIQNILAAIFLVGGPVCVLALVFDSSALATATIIALTFATVVEIILAVITNKKHEHNTKRHRTD